MAEAVCCSGCPGSLGSPSPLSLMLYPPWVPPRPDRAPCPLHLSITSRPHAGPNQSFPPVPASSGPTLFSRLMVSSNLICVACCSLCDTPPPWAVCQGAGWASCQVPKAEQTQPAEARQGSLCSAPSCGLQVSVLDAQPLVLCTSHVHSSKTKDPWCWAQHLTHVAWVLAAYPSKAKG